MSIILAALPPILDKRLALTTLAMVSTPGILLLSVKKLSTQIISITIDTVLIISIQK